MKYIAIHGHFYQPPRENAWLEEIEVQESARPYHDWNERITDECYGPNAVSRILNDHGKIVDIRNNYARMSFNFGPTLLSWMEQKRPDIYTAILEADKLSRQLFGGHGSAMAQVYNHIIMPLANRRDKETQVIWGIQDFERRFNRLPEGMWLAETAVDTETLEVLAENGIRFTILAPRQAKRFRKAGAKEWQNGIDSRRPYRCNLPSGRSITLFFYDGERSQAVAFGGILKDGRKFAETLTSGFSEQVTEPELVHIATDGESYGHHHRNGDMALAYCMNYIEANGLAQLTNYAQYLDLVEVDHEVEIHEDSSWSCAHGVERWRNDCGCATGGRPDWNQQWRSPLREALNWLRDKFAALYEVEMAQFHDDVWGLRNDYVKVPLKRSITRAEAFLRAYIPRELKGREVNLVLALLELQRQSLYMFTSCGWFFDEISGIEPVQILQYANRGLQLARVYFDADYEGEFLELLGKAPSNLPEYNSGAEIYAALVARSRLTLTDVGMHYAVRSIFTDEEEKQEVLNYVCKSEEFERYNAGAHRLVLGITQVKSKITLSNARFSFVILYLGHHHVIGLTFNEISIDRYRELSEQLKIAFESSNLSEVIQLMHAFPEQDSFSFFDMFKDEQINLLEGIIEEQLVQANNSYAKINNRNYHLMNVMRSTGLEVPETLRKNLELVLRNDLKQLFEDSDRRVSIRKLKTRVSEAAKWKIELDLDAYSYLCGQRLSRIAAGIPARRNPIEALDNIREVLEHIRPLGLHPPLNLVQDFVFHELQRTRPGRESEPYNAAIIRLAEAVNLDAAYILARRPAPLTPHH